MLLLLCFTLGRERIEGPRPIVVSAMEPYDFVEVLSIISAEYIGWVETLCGLDNGIFLVFVELLTKSDIGDRL